MKDAFAYLSAKGWTRDRCSGLPLFRDRRLLGWLYWPQRRGFGEEVPLAFRSFRKFLAVLEGIWFESIFDIFWLGPWERFERQPVA